MHRNGDFGKRNNVYDSLFYLSIYFQLSQKREMFFNNTAPGPQTTPNIPSVPASFGPNVNNTTSAAPSVNISNNTINKENISAAPSSTTYAKEMSVREMDGYVGFANLPNQVYRKAVKKGFDFTLLVVGK